MNGQDPIRRRKRNLYKCFMEITADEFEDRLIESDSREEKAFYRTLLNLKLQLEQEKIVGEPLV
jgi:hypothetical protein